MSGFAAALARHACAQREAWVSHHGLGVALIGTGQVARALARQLDAAAPAGLHLAQVVNQRGALDWQRPGWEAALDAHASEWPKTRPRQDASPRLSPFAGLVIDASASDAVAASHAEWLAAGRVVVTANKRALGESAARAAALQAALARGGRYGDSATVGAGLGAIARLRAFVACGEPVHEIAGVLSGSLAWLFDRFDGRRGFAELVDEARLLGLTEPDPRQDVAGLDVARKLRILARAAGWRVDDDAIRIDPRLQRVLDAPPAQAFARLDRELDDLFAQRPDADARLAVVARARPEGGRIELEWLARDDALAQRRGCENCVQIRTRRYDEHALVLRGPGAGPALTAAALIEDVLRLAPPRAPGLAA